MSVGVCDDELALFAKSSQGALVEVHAHDDGDALPAAGHDGRLVVVAGALDRVGEGVSHDGDLLLVLLLRRGHVVSVPQNLDVHERGEGYDVHELDRVLRTPRFGPKRPALTLKDSHMTPVFLGGYEDVIWCTRTKFGSGVAKSLTSYISASGGGEVSIELNYEHLVDRLEFTEFEIRSAVGHLIAHGYARINSNHDYYSGDVLELITPGRRAEDARLAEKKRQKEEERAAKIALRGGRVNRAPIPDEVRSFVFERDGHACRKCGSEEDLTLDHIHPWSIGGPDTADNLQVLCRPCNSSKGDRVA